MHQQAIALGNLQQKPYTYPLIEWGKSTDFPSKKQKKRSFSPPFRQQFLKTAIFFRENAIFGARPCTILPKATLQPPSESDPYAGILALPSML